LHLSFDLFKSLHACFEKADALSEGLHVGAIPLVVTLNITLVAGIEMRATLGRAIKLQALKDRL
jgi:hypothetical protein